MNPVAVIIDNTEIRWDSILAILAIAAWWFRFHALYCANGGRRLAGWLFLPLALLFGSISSHLIYWYSHIEQFSSLKLLLTDLQIDHFSMLGILPGIVLAAALLRLVRAHKDLPAFLDALAPASAMGMGLLYLCCLFNQSCRGKFEVTFPQFQCLPFASPVAGAEGTEYRFATFFVSFLFLLFTAHLCTMFYHARKEEKGATSCFFLMLFGAGQFILDSTRYDAEYFAFNGFVSILQIFTGLSFLGMGIGLGIRAVKRRGWHWYFVPLWLLLAGCMTAAGIMEYLVQRYADMHDTVYAFMGLSCLGMILFCYILYALGRKKAPAAAAETAAEALSTTEAETADLVIRDFEKTAELPNMAALSENAEAGSEKTGSRTGTDEKRSKRKQPGKRRDERPAIFAFLSAVMAAVGLSALFASRQE